MIVLLPSFQTTINTTTTFLRNNKLKTPPFYTLLRTNKFAISLTQPNYNYPFHVSFSLITKFGASATTTTTHAASVDINSSAQHFMVIVDKPPANIDIQSKALIIDFYVSVLKKALPSNNDKDAQRCIYDAYYDSNSYGFCCIVDEPTSRVLAGLPGVLSVKPDPTYNSVKDYSKVLDLKQSHMSNSHNESGLLPNLLPKGSNCWVVRVVKPSAQVSSKAQMVDYYVSLLTKVLGSEKDAQVCMYHVSSQSDLGFCCILDDDHAQELAVVPGVLSVLPDECFESRSKDYGGTEMSKTKLFVTGLSFYTSEKTLRAAFEPFGELAGVKVIMDKISNRSKGYAFVEYTNEESATTALGEMNGKIINGWMIVVDRAKRKPRLSSGRRRPLFSEGRKAM